MHLEQNKKLAQQKLSSKELYELKKRQKKEARKKERRKEKLKKTSKKIGRYAFYILIGAGLIGLLGWFLASRPNLPPISSQGHIESYPPANILNQPIPLNIQAHILEHVGRIGPGIIIQYNCKDFDCEPDLVQKLAALVEQYPGNVYLAPNNYDGKIILTKLGKREILDNFDEQAIRNFIE